MKGPSLGYKAAKQRVLAALTDGSYRHEARNEIDIKNQLLMGGISPEQVAEIIKKSTGKDHSMSPHHAAPAVTVHTIVCLEWYVKFYFVDPETVFISVHQ
jgi:hypothetical protein